MYQIMKFCIYEVFFMIMTSGEIDYSEIFFKDKPPLGWAENWDQDWESVPFPFITYSMFLVFFFFVSIVALNVLVGLTVDDIRNFLDNADLRKLAMRLKFVLVIERVNLKNYNVLTSERIEKPSKKGHSTKSDMISKEIFFDGTSKAMIWEMVEKKQEDIKKKGETEEERKQLKDMIHNQTLKLKSLTSNVESLLTQMKKQEAKMESMEKMMMKGRSDGE